jgi:hypothetical protein
MQCNIQDVSGRVKEKPQKEFWQGQVARAIKSRSYYIKKVTAADNYITHNL